MKTFLKIIQYILKFIAYILYKVSAKYTYTKIFKQLMKYKIISLIYKPLKLIFTNFLYLFKLITAIIVVLSLFNVSLIYYNFDIIDEATNIINSIINWFKTLYFTWFPNEDIEDIPEPKDFLINKKESKIIEKSVQHSKNNYWIIPLIIIGYGAIYYYNPQLMETLQPILNKTDEILPDKTISISIVGIFIYKGLIFAITHLTGYDLNIFIGDDKPSEEDLTQGIENQFRNDSDSEPLLLTDNERRAIEAYQRSIKDQWEAERNNRERSFSPTNNLDTKYLDEIKELFPKEDDLESPKASTSKLTNINENRPINVSNPIKKVKCRQFDLSSVKFEDWDK
uniref:Uncharacterized protein n=1 Tax=Tylopilus plumbeoviolaceoides TaxID=374766 RepID=A0A8F0WNA0_9AGAM|nr:hypothetical protein KYW48_mgp11 [Tylopilus plumbeoviolaceoides]QWM97171.1 hypothetical protein [Tylopilus plumbeoviolaceoides]